MRSRLTIVLLVLAAVVLFVAALFVVQNSARSTELSLDLGFAAWQLAQPVSVMALVGIAFGVGLVIALALTLPRLARLGRRVRALERQVSIGDGQDEPWR